MMDDLCIHCGHPVVLIETPVGWGVFHRTADEQRVEGLCPDGSGRFACLAQAGVE